MKRFGGMFSSLGFSIHGGVDWKRLVFVDGGRAEQDTRASAAASEFGFFAGMSDGSIDCALINMGSVDRGLIFHD